MMPIRFDAERHLPDVNGWLVARGQLPIPVAMLSSTGYTVPGVAAGWMYLTDSSVCLLDAFVANPEAPSKARHAALSAITGELLREAKRCRCSHVVGYTGFRGLASIVKRHGMTEGPSRVVLTKEL